MTKDEIRAAAKAARRVIAPDAAAAKGEAVWERLRQLDEYVRAKTVMAYMSAFGEVDTGCLIDDVLAYKRLILPVSDVESFDIIPCLVRGREELRRGAYGIYEPQRGETVSESEIDLAIIPGVAFDMRGARMGFGKGYYDRFLSRFRGIKIGLCYEVQLFDEIPTEEHDIGMDFVITEKRVYNDF